MLRTFLTLGGLLVLGGVVAGLALLFMMYKYSQGLPDYSQLANYDPPVVSRLYAADGQLLCEYAVEKRVFVPINEIPKQVINAFLAAEDKNFYTHSGVDFMGVVRAIFNNLTNFDHRPMGASTITQQVVKNFLLTNEISYTRKIREAILAFRIEKAFTKDKILELYLNQIYLGNSAYGVGAAAIQYFDKPLDQLTIEEAAYLAALPKAPNNYQVDKNYDEAKGRRDWVIERMEEERFITRDQAKAARAATLHVRKKNGLESVRADYFCEEVRRMLEAQYGADQLYKGGLVVHTTLDPALQKYAETAFNDGLAAYDRRHGWRGKPLARLTSLEGWQGQLAKMHFPLGINNWEAAVVLALRNDGAQIGIKGGQTGTIPFSEMSWARKTLPDQKLGAAPQKPSDVLKIGEVIAVERLNAEAPKSQAKGAKPVAAVGKDTFGLRQIPDVNGGMLVMDPHSGRILAMVGGFSFEDKKAGQFNRVTQAQRQTGSAIKPLVYLTGLEHGMTPATLILDEPISLSQGPGLPMWEPDNYTQDFAGPITMRYGLEQSRNLMTIRIALTVGIDEVVKTFQRLGIADKLPAQYSIALGAWETTLLRMTAAYAGIADGGRKVTPIMIDRIHDRRGKILYRADQRGCDICKNVPWMDQKAPVLAETDEQLIDPTYNYQLISMMQGVIDRGTARRVSALGVPIAGKTGTTNDYKDAWFIGFTPDLVAGVYVGFDQPRTLGSKETGASVSAPIFMDFMRDALKKYPAKPFRIPEGIRLMTVDAKTGEPAYEGDPGTILEAFRSDKGWHGNGGIAIDGTNGIPDGESGGFFRSLFDGVY